MLFLFNFLKYIILSLDEKCDRMYSIDWWSNMKEQKFQEQNLNGKLDFDSILGGKSNILVFFRQMATVIKFCYNITSLKLKLFHPKHWQLLLNGIRQKRISSQGLGCTFRRPHFGGLTLLFFQRLSS